MKEENYLLFGRSKCRQEVNIKHNLDNTGQVGLELDTSCSGQGQVLGSCKHNNETSDCMKKRRND